ncbi:GAF domain-containing protein [Oerskovia turbata]|uniref:GAF domain-containing protein n=1 Tax=Oerskovia turbata TaxID=1713 RepID=A0A4Q1KST4_9CELL|nr:GAF domain-containing protein [Oerskovia turbata]RXR25324.1 GAF domain-containing protein [Oerskovia turbata]RXR32735.1 GAF domain-containing protein [Oerskovia turbata]
MTDPAALSAAHEAFLSTGALPPGIRPLVAASWRRSARSGVDPDVPQPDVSMSDADLGTYRARHPLASAMPVVRDLLVAGLAGESAVVAMTDDSGRILWVEGSARVRDDVGRIGFVEGAVWREERVGTNAPGTALATGRPVQVLGAEHFTRPVQSFNCAAAPVRDLRTGRVLGVLDVTGGHVAASGLVLSLVRASVAAVERELAERSERSERSATGHGPFAPRLDVLGVSNGVLRAAPGAAAGWPAPGTSATAPDGGTHAAPSGRLSLRHSEILLLLAASPRGLGADELAVLLHPGELSDVTVRAEVSRLRRAVGPLLGGSRPYRLGAPLRTDLDTVRDLLAAGDVHAALTAYPGPVLPRSVAPGVERLRDELSAEVRGAVLASGDVGALGRWLASDEGADDHAAWRRLGALAAPGTPAAARARARLALLDRSLR